MQYCLSWHYAATSSAIQPVDPNLQVSQQRNIQCQLPGVLRWHDNLVLLEMMMRCQTDLIRLQCVEKAEQHDGLKVPCFL